jgi:hypothetical protein
LALGWWSANLLDQQERQQEDIENLKRGVSRLGIISAFQREKFPKGLSPQGKLDWFIDTNHIDRGRLSDFSLDGILLKTPTQEQ